MAGFIRYISALCVGTVMVSCAQPSCESPVTVFRKGECGYDTYRIPALVQTRGGAILAFAEARKNGAGDTGDIDLVLKRSVDGGRSWSESIMVWDDGENVCGNPSPVVDAESGRVLLVMTWNDGRDPEKAIHARESVDVRRVFVCHSDDEGLTWSEPVEISESTRLPEWTWYATGPCHALQLRSPEHRGRVVVACNHGVYDEGPKGTVSHVIVSDDFGDSWHIGAVLPVGNEATIAEMRDGRLIINMRGAKSPERLENPYRWAAVSSDGGESFGEPYLDRGLVEPVCNGSIINYSPAFSKLSGKLLFSNPADTTKRVNMTVSLSRDGGAAWEQVWHLPGARAAYSDLCVLSDGSPAILYETGVESPYEQIVFTRLR